MEIDNEQVFKGEIFSLNVGICQYNGGGMKQVPNAIPDDGLFDVTLIKKASKLLPIVHFNKLYKGTLIDLPFVSAFRGKHIRIRSVEKLYLEADGESLGQGSDFLRFSPVPGLFDQPDQLINRDPFINIPFDDGLAFIQHHLPFSCAHITVMCISHLARTIDDAAHHGNF